METTLPANSCVQSSQKWNFPLVMRKWQQKCFRFGSSPKSQSTFTDGMMVGFSSDPFQCHAFGPSTGTRTLPQVEAGHCQNRNPLRNSTFIASSKAQCRVFYFCEYQQRAPSPHVWLSTKTLPKGGCALSNSVPQAVDGISGTVFGRSARTDYRCYRSCLHRKDARHNKANQGKTRQTRTPDSRILREEPQQTRSLLYP
jgi:hypothetical protein